MKSGIIFLCLTLLGPFAAQAQSLQVSLCSDEDRRESVFYKELLHLNGNEGAAEKAKILYLIDLVKHSPHTFIRNGDAYSGVKAARHLQTKYGYTVSRIKRAEDFIDYLASKSSVTGKAYLIQTESGKTYPARDVFYEELGRLNQMVAEKKSAAPA